MEIMSDKLKVWLLVIAVLLAIMYAARVQRNYPRDPSDVGQMGAHDWP
jgi:hypothetical protein